MNKFKVVVYAISKNEEKFVKRWVKSMSEADEIYVLDTGSSDNTVKELTDLGIKVKSKTINPWRFDVARNLSLELVPKDTDICICTDLDEVLLPGWRKKLEELWTPETTRLRYNYNWRLDENDVPLVNFYIEKIHKREGYTWTHPVHEVLSYEGIEKFVTTDEITVNHYPDDSKSRSSYLPLLELSVKEHPEDDRNVHYLGREYMYYGKWNEAIDTLIRHLSLPTALWKDERCASMRFIARCYTNLSRYEEAKMWLDKAMKEAPHLRDPFAERALLAYDLKNWNDVIKYASLALEIESHPKSYINEMFSFDGTLEDMLSLAYYNLGDIKNALKWVDKALSLKKSDERLENNRKVFLNNLKEK
ncbi:MAG TPA: glycosyl transferase family 2 [Firmicutes bacterium]|nr:glycosyl transferase family 2 [Bacillota bacterium]